MFEPSKVYEKIKKYPVISFDIFDTLVKRNVPEPKVIFDVVEEAFNQEYPEYSIHGFREQRIQAERRARQLCQKEEIKFEQIYGQLDWEQELCRKLQELEIETEVKYCQPNYLLKEVYDKCITAGHRVVITSDMYLPQEVIVRILQKCGYAQYEKLYLSSEIGLRKRTGKLFDYILQDLKVGKKDIVHVGDGRYVDYLVPRLKGLHCLHITRKRLNTHFLTRKAVFAKGSRMLSFINNNLPKYDTEPELFQWGYEILGPLLLGFATWIHEQIRANSITKAFFLARDMYLVKDIYCRLYGSERVEYLEVSRRSLRNAYVKKKECLAAVFDTVVRKEYTFGDVLAIFAIEKQELPGDIDLSLPISQKTKMTAAHKRLNDAVLTSLKKRSDLTEEYLKQMNLSTGEQTAIIDIGWHASIQNMLETLIDKPLQGFYFGSTVRHYFKPMNVKGYWFTLDDELQLAPFWSMVYILEVMLFPCIGTTTGYTKYEGHIVPCYAPCEMKDYDAISQLQRGCLNFVVDYREFEPSIGTIASKEAALGFQKLAFEPTAKQARLLASIPYEDGEVFGLAPAQALRKYIFHPLRLYKDYRRARWKEGFLKQVVPLMPKVHPIAVVCRKIVQRVEKNI